jgi:hypothetical protein
MGTVLFGYDIDYLFYNRQVLFYNVTIGGRMLVKITENNVTKVAEEILEQSLDYLYHHDTRSNLIPLIEAELDRRDRILEDQKQKQKVYKSELNRLIELHEISHQIDYLLKKHRKGKMDLLISRLGMDYADDYVIDEVSNTVHSLVSHMSSFDVPSQWEHENYEQAVLKVRVLIYYRIYNRYMRDATKENLDYIKRMIGE